MSSARLINRGFVFALVLLTASAAAVGALLNILDAHLTKLPIEPQSGLTFHNLPRRLPTWHQVGEDKYMSSEAVDELGTSNFISRMYKKDRGPGEDPLYVDLHCAYYTGMIDTVPHVPERCLVGAGAAISGPSRLVNVPLSFMGEDGLPRITPDQFVDAKRHGTIYSMRSTVTNSRVRLPRGIEELRLRVTPFTGLARERTVYAGYFFIANGGVVASSDEVRTLAFRLTDDYAYYAKVQFTSAQMESAEQLGEVVGDLLDELLPEIMRCVPDWIEVAEGRYPAERGNREQ